MFIRAVSAALGKEEAEALLYSNEAGSQLASLSQRNLDHFHLRFEHSEMIKVTTLDCYCEKQEIGRISLLKLDLEGHELEALQGARGMLAKRAIDAITFEFGGANIDSKTYFRDLWTLLKKDRYKVCRITPSGYFFALPTYKEYYEQFRTTNFIAIPE
jgi:FkbM family methyltransferase